MPGCGTVFEMTTTREEGWEERWRGQSATQEKKSLQRLCSNLQSAVPRCDKWRVSLARARRQFWTVCFHFGFEARFYQTVEMVNTGITWVLSYPLLSIWRRAHFTRIFALSSCSFDVSSNLFTRRQTCLTRRWFVAGSLPGCCESYMCMRPNDLNI